MPEALFESGRNSGICNGGIKNAGKDWWEMPKSKQKKGILLEIIVLSVIAAVIALLFFLNYYTSKTYWNDNFVNGNTTGNLNNGGLFCESEGYVYFSNPYDNGAVYSMRLDETELKRLCDGPVSNINADSHYFYYVKEKSNVSGTFGFISEGIKGIFRRNRNGKKPVSLYGDKTGMMHLIGNYIYYQQYNEKKGTYELYRVKIDGNDRQRLTEEAANPSGYQSGRLYYNTTLYNHNLYQMSTESGSPQLLYEGNFWFCTPDGEYIYFMDAEHNYALARIDLNTGEKETLTTERLDTFNLYGDFIYYQVSDPESPMLRRMKKDGTEVATIAEGVFKNIHITSEYVYFTAFGQDTPIYKSPVNGPAEVTTFEEAAKIQKP